MPTAFNRTAALGVSPQYVRRVVARGKQVIPILRRLLGLPFAFCCAVAAAPLIAADGDLDLSFGTPPGDAYGPQSGTAYLYWYGYLAGAYAHDYTTTVLTQRDGKVILVASLDYKDAALNERTAVGVARMTSSGLFDDTFGTGVNAGETVLASAGTDNWTPTAAALSADGSIVVVGKTSPLNSAAGNIAVWRLASNGQPDAAFGTSGMVVIDRGIPAAEDNAGAVVIGDGSNEPLNSIFIAGDVFEVPFLHQDFALFFLDAAGNPLVVGSANIGNQSLPNAGRWWRGPASCPGLNDSAGRASFSAMSFNPQYFAGETVDNYYLLAAGTCYSYSSNTVTAPPRAVVVAFNDLSNLDSFFGGGGFSYFSYGDSIASYPSDARAMQISIRADTIELITVAGVATVASDGETHPGVARLTGSGQFDPDFGAGGHLTINVGACCGLVADSSVANALLVQEDGKTVLGVTEHVADGKKAAKALLRLNTDGGGDASFGIVGLLAGARFYHLPIEEEGSSGVYAEGTGVSMAFSSGEEIVLAGTSIDGFTLYDVYASAIRVQANRIFTTGFDPVPQTP